jgi:CRP-like cAMP-binding protein
MGIDNPLVRKLRNFTAVSDAEAAVLDQLATGNQMRFAARRDLTREGDPPRFTWLVLEGWAARYKLLPDGRRQIVGFLLPGDLCDLEPAALDRMDHSISAVSALRCAAIMPRQLEPLMRWPNLRMAFGVDRMVNFAIQREWIVSLGQRNATERIANFICELYLRLARVGLAPDARCFFPITQRDMADAAGLSTVHVNRVLRDLRERGLIEWRGRNLRIPRPDDLMEAALFNANFLRLDRPQGRRSTPMGQGSSARL